MRQNLGASSGPTVRHRYFTYFCFKTFRAQLFLLKNDTFSLLMFLAGNEMNEIKENFEAKGCPGFPEIIGVIDRVLTSESELQQGTLMRISTGRNFTLLLPR